MKLYHIDRSGHLKSGDVISLVENFSTGKMNINDYYKEGLSSHGIHYFTNDAGNKDYFLDVVFEYERILHYPDKLSRYQAFYCFDEYGAIDFINNRYLEDNFYKIYEIEVSEDNYEKHNMSLIKGWSHQAAIKYARLYWENKEDNTEDNKKSIYEYLVKLPVTIGREVKLSELEEIVGEKKY